ncbi:MAG: 3-methyl-2-oxobutanoate hydroxymethyltransferase [Thermoanaerobacterales bacterium]|nr:3-methyl-2-oxobutanoate hydroxymethyltransferase [Bacillota bacterium]MDI6907771.1 3-methyl-2-oxobutanoate hydroxymethyltransferase [Thermoanaerobacterales bacterium]
MSEVRVTTATLRQMKAEGRPVTMLTAYDFPLARLVDEAGIDVILVGDSLGNVVLGYETTVPVTMDDMVHHVRAVARGVRRALVVADMPFLSYQVSVEDALRNAGRLLQEGGAHAVKIEGGAAVLDVVRALVGAGIPVMGHLGLTPQSVHQLGGFKVQARDAAAANRLLDEARALEEAGIFALVLECIPAPLARMVTGALGVPTIGIGAGPDCDGQVLVTHDLLGLTGGRVPRFVKQYADLRARMLAAVGAYRDEVVARLFPGPEHTFGMPEDEIERLRKEGAE